MQSDPAILRGLERILAVVIGGVSVWLGYRLFFAIPDRDADGRAELSLSKDRRLLVTRIGPGAYFGLFGMAIVVASFYFGVTREAGTAGAGAYSGMGGGAAGPLPPAPAAATEADRAGVRRDIALLNQLRARAGEGLTAAQAEAVDERLRAFRLRLMESVWSDAWGDSVEFVIWLDGPEPRPADPRFAQALAFYEAKE